MNTCILPTHLAGRRCWPPLRFLGKEEGCDRRPRCDQGQGQKEMKWRGGGGTEKEKRPVLWEGKDC